MSRPGSGTLPAAGVPVCHAVAVVATFAAVWGSLVGSLSAGIRRSPARASAPAARPRRRAAGPTVRPAPRPFGVAADGSYPGARGGPAGVSAALPGGGSWQGGPQLTAAAGVIPEHLAAVVFHPASAP